MQTLLKWQLAAATITSACLVGCASKYVAHSESSPDGKCLVNLKVRGAYGHSYDEESDKTVGVFVAINRKTGPSEVLKEFHVRGSDVTWDLQWDADDNFILRLYDDGPGTANTVEEKPGMPEHDLGAIAFDATNETLTQFVEK